MFKTNFILILSLFLISRSYSVDQVVSQYPELQDFLTSNDFVAMSRGCPLIVINQSKLPEASTQIGFEIGSTGIISKNSLVLNSAVDRNLLTAEELKFIICHELGHINDRNLIKRNLCPMLIDLAWRSEMCYLIVKNLINKKWNVAFQNGLLMACGCLAIRLIYSKLARESENIADRFAILKTKNLAAACNVLQLRKKWYNSSGSLFNLLLASHPSEDQRIQNITQIYQKEIESGQIEISS